MMKGRKGIFQSLARVLGDQRGITGLETAIVLIAFIVVAAVFAFAVLTTGLFSTEQTKETAQAGLGQVRSTLNTKGSVTASGDGSDIRFITFSLTNSAGADPVNLATDETLIKYVDPNNSLTAKGTDAAATGDISWSRTWLLGSEPNVDPGEVVEFTLTFRPTGVAEATGLATDKELKKNTTFTVTVIPSGATEITFSRLSPLEITNGFMDLK